MKGKDTMNKNGGINELFCRHAYQMILNFEKLQQQFKYEMDALQLKTENIALENRVRHLEMELEKAKVMAERHELTHKAFVALLERYRQELEYKGHAHPDLEHEWMERAGLL